LTSNATIPITVKIRSGWSKDNINAVSIAKQLQDAGASAVFIHARTKEQLYRGKADYDVIARVKDEVSIPVIGSGDVFGPEDVKRMLTQTGCDAVLVARGAMGNPWIFKHSQYFLKTGKLRRIPTIAERIKTIKLHLGLASKLYGEKSAVLRMRLFLPLYLKGIPHARKVRGILSELKTKKQLLDMISTLT
ncbi:MAG TPA: tRNA dihydrouridine synthase DusB, partial [Candidatus Omnitrophica bacterium]|nr:tRNA dihydrouridine synthase DusB [Candidatus Omnitrophota bacterium]